MGSVTKTPYTRTAPQILSYFSLSRSLFLPLPPFSYHLGRII
uniref:Uncharacterized protein n=1 Tax=Nelumbo nucifera TaxID=4432 RepID=A0A822ZBS6_NELNU|nr:TPA_asm: hypothetical protein HUJ06_014809 [Nelumbo nucifera]